MARKQGAKSTFAQLVGYMDRGVGQGDGERLIWHNLYGHERMATEELVAEFEANAKYLKARKNGNILYHEVLSLSAGHNLRREELSRAIAGIGYEYLRQRAPDQLAYGVAHMDSEHIHLHLCLSANEVASPQRVRLEKNRFATIQKDLETYVLTHYPELAQTRIYDKEHTAEKLKTTEREQEFKQRTGQKSRKEELKALLHGLFERAQNREELVSLLEQEGLSLYQRGKSIGIVDGLDTRKHRLSTLGLVEHYELTKARLTSPSLEKTRQQAESRREELDEIVHPVREKNLDEPIPPREIETEQDRRRNELDTITRRNDEHDRER